MELRLVCFDIEHDKDTSKTGSKRLKLTSSFHYDSIYNSGLKYSDRQYYTCNNQL